MSKEIWKVIPSLPMVKASTCGRLRVIPIKGYKSKPTFGYWQEKERRYHFKFKGKSYRPARLICEAFHGSPPPGKNVCMHIDENARNNRPENLKWTTQKENLNCPGFIKYCCSRTGENSPIIKGMKKRL